MKIGYARVSTFDQELGLSVQERALSEYGCDTVYLEKCSSIKERDVLSKVLSQLKPNDFLVVCSLDRLGRNLRFLLDTVSFLNSKNIHLVSLKENIDTSTSTGRLVFNIFGSLAEFERELISERTKNALSVAKTKGIKLGRKRMEENERYLDMALIVGQLYHSREVPVDRLCLKLNMSRSTFYRYLKLYNNHKYLSNE